MANAEMRFLRLYNNLNQAIELQQSVLPPIRSHDHIVYFIIFVASKRMTCGEAGGKYEC